MKWRLEYGFQIWRHLGPRWLLYRARRACRIRFGALRRELPQQPWNSQPLADFLQDPQLAEPARYWEYRQSASPPFLFSPTARAEFQAHFAQWDRVSDDPRCPSPVSIADDLAAGHLRFFEHHRVTTGLPPDWHRHAWTGERLPADRHWSTIGDFSAGDLKVVWEPSRFAYAFALVRAYWRTGDERYPELFWQLLESWRDANPPQSGANWKCGQETALRVLAWCFAIYGLTSSQTSTASRVADLAQMIAVSAARIEADLGYALSQSNNHGISEAAGLWTVGLLFPEFRAAERWRGLGERWLEQQARELIALDGSFSQHSFNYQRVMLDELVWCSALGEAHGRPLSAETRERLGAAAELLFQVQDEESGQVPCYGHNDGALVLPMTNCDYRDFRPVVQAACYERDRQRRLDRGPWDESLLWLFGPVALAAPRSVAVRHDWAARDGGYFTFRTAAGFALVRACRFRHRPAHADQLHIDIWWRGLNVACDPGTYSYNSPSPWNNALVHTRYHNTVSVDDRDQMDRVGRFLWLPWCTAQIHVCESGEHWSYWEAEHNGYRRLASPVAHRRTLIRLGGEHWLVLDDVSSRGSHRIRLQWLLADAPCQSHEYPGSRERRDRRIEDAWTLQTPRGPYAVRVGSSVTSKSELVRASPTSPDGWRAPYYAAREPAISLAVTADTDAVRFWTLLGPPNYELLQDTDEWQLVLPTLRVCFPPLDRLGTSDLLGRLQSSETRRGAPLQGGEHILDGQAGLVADRIDR